MRNDHIRSAHREVNIQEAAGSLLARHNTMPLKTRSIIVLSLFILAMGQSALAGCFVDHIRDAIRSNRKRAPLYSQLSNGKSQKISRKLIFDERTTLLIAQYVEHQAQRYEEAGVPILCQGFVSMADTPSFQPFLSPDPAPLNDFVNTDANSVTQHIIQAYKKQQFAGVTEAVQDELSRLKSMNYNCMQRHVLESIRRFSALAPAFSSSSQKRGLKPPNKLVWKIIKLQLFALPTVLKLDESAAPLQAEGLPILCRDVPPIPPN